ncbi:expressed unknown protein [Seminavis robusta]|uniref:Myb-like domain-containing protein n=1 Tax=Seminavis robusta TaxID=568900 RepID=A0A9N8DPW7_9STRA|nr:expressed unknown protein [Seminavis robusta]|eukprot:Sro176_g077190.1 n/a (141) ;mRNA; f:4119-4541
MPPKRKPEEKAEGETTIKEEEGNEKLRATEPAGKKKSAWTASEDDALLKAVIEDQQDREAEGNGDEEEDWDEIAKSIPNKTPVQCLKRYMSLNKKGQAKGAPEPQSVPTIPTIPLVPVAAAADAPPRPPHTPLSSGGKSA